MRKIARDLDRMLSLLRDKMRDQGFTQLEVQDKLGWGRSYISQLVTKQKSIRLEQVLLILNVIGVDPGQFFAELYPASLQRATWQQPTRAAARPQRSGLSREARQVKALLLGLTEVLKRKGVINKDKLRQAVEAARQEEF